MDDSRPDLQCTFRRSYDRTQLFENFTALFYGAYYHADACGDAGRFHAGCALRQSCSTDCHRAGGCRIPGAGRKRRLVGAGRTYRRLYFFLAGGGLSDRSVRTAHRAE
ncbi:hypothetical protein D3C73_1349630 [compost metagenome]